MYIRCDTRNAAYLCGVNSVISYKQNFWYNFSLEMKKKVIGYD